MEFDQLRNQINQMMSTFEGGQQGRRRRSGGLNEWDMGGEFFPGHHWGGEFFPGHQWGGGFFDDPFELGNVGGHQQQQRQKGLKGQEEMKSLEADQPQQQITPRGAQRTTQIQSLSQPGHTLSTFKPLHVLKARCNVEEMADKFQVTADLPGFDKSNVKINVSDDGLLSIKGEQTKEWVDQSKEKMYCFAERSFANVQRTLRIPKGVDCTKITASYENGVLHVNLPKHPEELNKIKQEITIQ